MGEKYYLKSQIMTNNEKTPNNGQDGPEENPPTEDSRYAQQPIDESHKAILAHEISETKVTKSLPSDSRANDKLMYAITPTGEKAHRIQYVGKVTNIERKKKNNYEWLKMKCTDGRLPVTINVSENHQTAFEKLTSTSVPAYVAFFGYIQTWEYEGDTYSKLEAISANVVSKQERIRFLMNAAENTLKRVKSASEGVDTYKERLAAKEYRQVDFHDFADAAEKALKHADEMIHNSQTPL